MSRILGIHKYTHQQNTRGLVQQMLAAVRGNDWTNRSLGTPLVEFCWSGQRTPNIVEHEDIIVAIDGHVYNRKELGGHSNTDAALVANLYKQYGFKETLKHLNGDFSISLHDTNSKVTWVARDRFGIKPLYYIADPDHFAFASRPRALLCLPWVTKELNRAFIARFAASHYRYFDNTPHESPYRDIAQLPAAHLLCVENGKLTTDRYWSLNDLPDLEEPIPELAKRYRELLLDAVDIRLKEARRPIFSLSGGMDSSSVLACAVNLTTKAQHATSTVYSDATYDESDEIRSMLDMHVSEWHPVHIGTPNVLELVQEMLDYHDEPVATATWLSHYLMCRSVAEEGFDGLFGGLGGDELNAGEYEYFTFFFADLRHAGKTQLLTKEVDLWARNHDHPIFRKNTGVMENNLTRLTDLQNTGKCLPDLGRMRRYRATINAEFSYLDGFEPVMDHPFTSYLKNRTYQDLTRETLPCCLRAEDRHTTAFGLDHFLPFLDHRLVEFMFRIPGTLKIRDGVTKILLRDAMTNLLPRDTRTRVKKTGWNAPAHVWLSGQGRPPLMDLVHSKKFKERGIYDVKQVQMLIDEHETLVAAGNGEDNHMMFLWQLVNLELWLQWVEQDFQQPPST